jgi:FUN14 domain-containing protein 1
VKCEEKPQLQQFISQYMGQDNILGVGQPMGFGLASGFCSGYFLKKVGRAACVTLGVVFVMFQSAAQAGYLTVNWPKIEKDFQSVVGDFDVQNSTSSEQAVIVANKAAKFFTDNTGIASGAFVAGFVLGIRKG